MKTLIAKALRLQVAASFQLFSTLQSVFLLLQKHKRPVIGKQTIILYECLLATKAISDCFGARPSCSGGQVLTYIR